MKNLQILQIEDNPGDARLVLENLKAARDLSGKYTLQTVENFTSAKSFLEHHGCDAILLDLSLPDSTGLKTLEQIRHIDREVPIIILSGTDDTDTAARAVKYGAQDFLVKGHFDPFILSRSIQFAIERKEKESALQKSEEKLRSAQAIGNLGIWEFDSVRQEISWSDQMYAIFERNPELGAPSMEEEAAYYPEEEFNRFWDVGKRVMDERVAADFDCKIVLPEGKKKYLSAAMKPVLDPKDDVSGIMCTMKDITYLKEAIRREYEQKELLKELLIVTSLVNQTLDRENVISEILNGLNHLIHYSFANVMEFQNGDLVEIARRRNSQGDGNEISKYVISRENVTPFIEAAKIEKAIIVQDTHNEETINQLNIPSDPDIRSLLAAPIGKNGEMTGAIILGHKSPHFFNARHKEILIPFAIQASIAIQNANNFNNLKKQNKRLSILREIDDIIMDADGLGQNIDFILDKICEYLEVRAVALYGREKTNHHYNLIAYQGYEESPPLQKSLIELNHQQDRPNPGSSACRYRINANIAGADSASKTFPTVQSGSSCLFYPIWSGGNRLGFFEVVSDPAVSDQKGWDEAINTIIIQLALILDKGEMIESLRQTNQKLLETYDQTLKGWVETLHFRDAETEEHTQRVVEMTLEIARRFNFDEDEIDLIWRGALLHDIGKIGVPDTILLKPGPLDDEEWRIMKQHPTIAYQILSKIEYLKDAADIPYCHHEKWDGSGYPRGLAGEEIPLYARIFTVADVWDALISDRPYRDAWPEENATAYIRDQAGKYFDPNIVNVFLDIINEKRIK